MMGFIWFWLVAGMLAAYVVLDGFDLGVGILYLLSARTEEHRRTMTQSIGPVWNGNEVWLIASGGTLYFAFPLLYASAFSGFYLPLMIVLWLLILRAIGVELRAHSDSQVWRSFFDGLFFLSSALLAIFFGAALATVIRGVPIGDDHYFFLPLWTNWRVGPQPGLLDWYTVTGGLLALVALAMHGALYTAFTASGELERRARTVARSLWPGLVALTLISLLATVAIRRSTLVNYEAHPLLFVIPVTVLAALVGMRFFTQKGDEMKALLSSSLFLVAMLVGAAAALYPTLLPSSTDPSRDLTIREAISGPYALQVGLAWWCFGILLAILYFVTIYRMFRGKVSGEADYGH
jgi:cytochrome bd ubiquinol oxidase subunit II